MQRLSGLLLLLTQQTFSHDPVEPGHIPHFFCFMGLSHQFELGKSGIIS
jgi:hypothetical protein